MSGDDGSNAGQGPDRTLPRGTAIAVVLTVALGIALVLIAQTIPHAQRPSYKPTPSFTTVTFTSTP